MKFSIKDVFSKCDQTLNGKLHFLCSDILESGPSLTPLPTDVLLRFRSFNYILVVEIEKVFHQIGLNPDHRDLVRFL